MFEEFMHNFTHNLFKPLLLFFYAGFLVPILHVKFEFPKAVYKGLTIYLLLAIGWHGGEELAALPSAMLGQAAGFMVVGFVMNTFIGVLAYLALRAFTRLRRVDAATVAGYYGSDSAGTFVTCLGVLAAAKIAYAPYMPVMLAVMEIPGCLVALFIISRLRNAGMDRNGCMPDEREQMARMGQNVVITAPAHQEHDEDDDESAERKLVGVGVGHSAVGHPAGSLPPVHSSSNRPASGFSNWQPTGAEAAAAKEMIKEISLEDGDPNMTLPLVSKPRSAFSPAVLHEVFFNPGIFLLFAGIAIGFIGRLQGESVTHANDSFFVSLFQGALCLFLLEMGMTASQRLRDLRTAGWPFIAFGIIAPNVFAGSGMIAAHAYSSLIGQPFEVGTYVLFAVLCGAASYIAVPAVQRLAIPEASPTLPLAASLGLTFSYNVTIGIPVYIVIAKLITEYAPVAAPVLS